jgi:lipopolysaccharide O-acetyltransferase
MSGLSGAIGRRFVALYRFGRRSRAKAFSLLAQGAFADFGDRSVIEPPVRLTGESRIAIGSDVFVGSDSWLQALGPTDEPPAIVIGDGTSIAGHCVLSARTSIRLGSKVLLARNVYIADHRHAFDDAMRAVLDQGIDQVAGIEIGDGAWLGQNVVVGPGVRIGRGAVIGANAVVLTDVPDHSVAVGAPARVVRSFALTVELPL